jgi:hypothetical protein
MFERCFNFSVKLRGIPNQMFFDREATRNPPDSRPDGHDRAGSSCRVIAGVAMGRWRPVAFSERDAGTRRGAMKRVGFSLPISCHRRFASDRMRAAAT